MISVLALHSFAVVRFRQEIACQWNDRYAYYIMIVIKEGSEIITLNLLCESPYFESFEAVSMVIFYGLLHCLSPE